MARTLRDFIIYLAIIKCFILYTFVYCSNENGNQLLSEPLIGSNEVHYELFMQNDPLPASSSSKNKTNSRKLRENKQDFLYDTSIDLHKSNDSNGELMYHNSFLLSEPRFTELSSSEFKTDMPYILPATAQLMPSDDSSNLKRKKNFSKMAKSLIMATRNVNKKSLNASAHFTKTSHSPTTTSISPTRLKIFEIGGYCTSKKDGLYDDPQDCENFIICYANRTFRTKCAYGTLWNHLRKECDFPEKVDCERMPTSKVTPTILTKTKTSARTSTPVIVPKLSIFTMNPSKTNNNRKSDPNFSTSIKTNILLIAIIIPLIILTMVIIAISLWYWHRKFKQQRKEMKLNNSISFAQEKSVTSSTNGQNLNDTENFKMNLTHKLASCCCYKKLANFTTNHKQFKPKMISSSVAENHQDRIRTKSISNTSNNLQKSELISSISIPMQTSKGACTSANSQNLNGNELQIASGSHVTLSSHFEENNWDYNFATRGLYLSQPWVRGRYTHALGSESIETSAVLTLDPATTEMSETAGGKVCIETGGSDTDGYYA